MHYVIYSIFMVLKWLDYIKLTLLLVKKSINCLFSLAINLEVLNFRDLLYKYM